MLVIALVALVASVFAFANGIKTGREATLAYGYISACISAIAILITL